MGAGTRSPCACRVRTSECEHALVTTRRGRQIVLGTDHEPVSLVPRGRTCCCAQPGSCLFGRRTVGHHETIGAGGPVVELFRDLDPANWRALNHNPIALLHQLFDQALALRFDELALEKPPQLSVSPSSGLPDQRSPLMCPLEASGTSGQKTVLNGGLNLSILDGWWAEAYDGAREGRRRGSSGAGPPRAIAIST